MGTEAAGVRASVVSLTIRIAVAHDADACARIKCDDSLVLVKRKSLAPWLKDNTVQGYRHYRNTGIQECRPSD